MKKFKEEVRITIDAIETKMIASIDDPKITCRSIYQYEIDNLIKKLNIKELQHFKDENIQVYKSDKPIHKLLNLFFNHKSDANKYLTADEQESLEKDFEEWVKNISWQ